MRWNDLSGAALLLPGQELRLSGGAAPAAEPSKKPAPPAAEPPRTEHVVRSGDSLWSISQARGVSVQSLLDGNDLTVNSLLRPGQRLSVSEPAPETVRTAQA
ncbi:LysM peptidoglycan-binding domain-containing protein, partial [Klebsiella pneumoniae]